VSTSGTAAAYSYCCSKGAFIGISLEGTVLYVRDTVNRNFYGYPATPKQLLLEGAVPQPPAATMLYNSLKVRLCGAPCGLRVRCSTPHCSSHNHGKHRRRRTALPGRSLSLPAYAFFFPRVVPAVCGQ
jgi:hypothetical protein